MKKLLFLGILGLIALSIQNCLIDVPVDMDDHNIYRLVFLVDPDDALIQLNGRVIGESFEFATSGSALRLRSVDNEIVIKKKGYKEEFIDLRDYTARKITIRRRLVRLEDMGKQMDETLPPPPPPGKQPLENEETPVLPEQPQIPEPPEEPVTSQQQPSIVKLEIEPAEAAIYLDGNFWGIVPGDGKIDNLRVAPGKHQLEVVKPGYESSAHALDIKEQKDIQLKIKLQKKN